MKGAKFAGHVDISKFIIVIENAIEEIRGIHCDTMNRGIYGDSIDSMKKNIDIIEKATKDIRRAITTWEPSTLQV